MVHLIDGTDAWVPIEANLIQEAQYEILDDAEYKCLEPGVLFEFYPGDIVQVEPHRFSDGNVKMIAKQLLASSNGPDRLYWEFMFLATLDRLPIRMETVEKYHLVMDRIKIEEKKGQFFYPAVLEKIQVLNQFNAKY